jgi:hypothetical protein
LALDTVETRYKGWRSEDALKEKGLFDRIKDTFG